nr:ribonuclease H-like domain, reverse transcriptase, RNA-dependent DNA polymerase [Tanacetum cinerariifolium]
MVAYLLKFDASEGFNQIIDFLNRISIKYALTVNPNIYVSCIKQFWTTVAVKQGVDCLPNEEIFAELARMGYEKPSTKLMFYKAFFSSQWKFLIHTILQCMSAKRTSWNEFSLSMASAVICLSSSRKFNFSKTGDANEHVEEVNTGDAAEGDDSAAHGEVPTVAEEQSIPSPTPPTPPPQPSQDIPSTSQLKRRVKKLKKRNKVRVLKLSSLQRVRTSQRVETSNDTVLDDESNQGRMIDKIDQDDVVVLKDDTEEDKEVADAVKDVEEAMEDENEPTKVQEVVDVVTTAKLITEVVIAASETVTAASANITIAEAQVHAATTATVTAAPARVATALIRRRKGVVIRDPEEESTTSTIISAETKSKDKGKGILVEEPKPLKKKQQIELDKQYARELHAELNKDIDWDEAIDHVKRKDKEDPSLKKYQAMKRKPQTETQAGKNMMLYLKNTKEQIKEDHNRALQKINKTLTKRAAKRRKLDKEVEDLKRHLQIMPNEDDDVYTEATPLARKVLVVHYEIIEMNNKPYYKIIRADGIHQLYISFLTLLRNFDREDLKALWSLVKEIFSTAKPKNFSNDFLLTTLGAMFETPDAHAQI